MNPLPADDAYESRLDALHNELARLYRSGSTDSFKLEGIWARIERLEAFRAQMQARADSAERMQS